MVDIAGVNNKIIGSITGVVTKSAFINAIGWLIVAILLIGASAWVLWWLSDRKKFNKKIIANQIINGFFYPTIQDKAKSVKLGKGGFEIIYLKKMKTWKLAHGARSGVNLYNFYILSDGYWYPGQMSANLSYIDANGGLIQVVTTNPTMRAQYTSLEKQIDTLYGEKQKFWDKYGAWIMNMAYILIMGVFVWLSFKEVAKFLGSGTSLANQMNLLAENINRLAVNMCTGNNGIVPIQ